MSPLKQAALCLALVVAAAVGWYFYESASVPGSEEASARGEQRGGGAGGTRIPGLQGGGGAVNVITAAVETDAGGESIVALGTAKAARSVVLFPQVTGVVTEVLFKPGETLKAGAVLLRLEDDEQRVAVDRARVSLEQAQDTLERSRTLAKTKTITAVALAEAETAAQLAEIELRSAEIALQRRSVAAPFAGIAGLTDVSVGDLVTSSTPITTLEDLAHVRVAFEVPERWAGRIAPDQPITAAAQALPGSDFTGRITGIDNRIDETTRTLRLEAELVNEGGAVKTGMAVNVTLRFESEAQLAVPTLSLQWDRRGSFVWKVVADAAQRADVAILRRESGVVIVKGDIQAGERVVVEGIQRLREGAKVADVGAAPAVAAQPALRDGLPAEERAPAARATGDTAARS